MREVQTAPDPEPIRGHATPEAAIRWAQTCPKGRRAARDTLAVRGSTVIGLCWSDFQIGLDLSEEPNLSFVATAAREVEWSLIGNADYTALTRTWSSDPEPVRVRFQYDVSRKASYGVMDRDGIVKAVVGKKIRSIQVSEFGVSLDFESWDSDLNLASCLLLPDLSPFLYWCIECWEG